MKKTASLLLIITSLSFGQLKFGIGGGFSSIQSPDYYTSSISSNGFNLSSGYNLGIKLKLSLPVIPIKPIAFFNYYTFKGSETYNSKEVKTSQNISSFGLGIEYAIIPGPLSPYFSVEAGLNNFGAIKVENSLISFSNAGTAKRIGVGVGFGAELNLMIFTLDGSIKYQFLNVTGKTADEKTISCLSVNLSVLF